MKVIILGAGQVGYNIARYLAAEENDITIVDQSAELLKRIGDTLDVQPVVGFASHPDVLQQAGASEADLMIAVTASDEVNIVACEVANSLFDISTKIARIRKQHYLDPHWAGMFARHHLSIDYIISPEVEVAKAIGRSIQMSGVFEVLSLLSNKVQVLGIRCTASSPLINTPLRLLPGLFPKLDLSVIFLDRAQEVIIPSGDHELHPGDDVYLAVSQEQLPEVIEACGLDEAQTRRIMIMGGGNIGFTLATELEKIEVPISTKIIELDPVRAETIARHLTQTEVLCGDVLDLELLSEAGIQQADTLIAVTDDDKVNIIASLLAKRLGASRTLTLLNNMSYASLVTSLGVDGIISPQSITVSNILQYIRQGRLRSAYSLRDGSVELMDAEVRENSHVVGLSIEDINIKGSLMIAAIARDEEVRVNPSKITIRVGDRLLLVASKAAIKKAEKLFASRPSYL